MTLGTHGVGWLPHLNSNQKPFDQQTAIAHRRSARGSMNGVGFPEELNGPTHR